MVLEAVEDHLRAGLGNPASVRREWQEARTTSSTSCPGSGSLIGLRRNLKGSEVRPTGIGSSTRWET